MRVLSHLNYNAATQQIQHETVNMIPVTPDFFPSSLF
jgi:hypothetical protein